MSENIHDVGSVVTLTATFTDGKTKARVDPEVVVCSVRPADAKRSGVLTPEVVKISTGVYQASVEADRPGRWYFSFDGAGGHQGSGEHSFQVRHRYVPR